MTITAAADGSALGNPGPAGWAWYVNDDCWRAGGWPHGTNNQGELMAVLDLFRATAHVPEEDLRVLCDSQYVINSITKWMPGWKRKGWRKADGKPVLNVELLKELDREIAGRKYTFEWVKGHAGHDLNEAADVRARAAATAYQQGVAARSGPGFAGAPAAVGPAADSRVAVSPGAGAALTSPRAATAASLQAATTAGGAGFDSQVSYGQDLFNQGPYEEPDLFSELESDSFIPSQSAGAEMSPEAIVEALERELSGPDIRGDIGRTGVLLHPDFMEIGTSGRVWTRDATMMALEEEPGQHTELEILGADRIGTSAILLTCRSYSRSGTALHSSLWVLDGNRWRLRFRQGTPEA
ncbi:RNase H family protein [Pseudarthrobacter raffinosi]|uniref:RNase H family protein n=1 Tax=Pseudarthrobacter raffinosi TaxID=2953651 RepID=UPI00208E01D6|nr:ribonuclease HI family protein [Pseudarthrobacter sp. MDT3-9]MCO4252992.1 ribonuclease HI family protein [Pseudarthrobacter sp. MDT3-9]